MLINPSETNLPSDEREQGGNDKDIISKSESNEQFMKSISELLFPHDDDSASIT